MELKFDVTGSERKELAKAMAEILECEASYKGAPPFVYEVGGYIIGRDGNTHYGQRQVCGERKVCYVSVSCPAGACGNGVQSGAKHFTHATQRRQRLEERLAEKRHIASCGKGGRF